MSLWQCGQRKGFSHLGAAGNKLLRYHPQSLPVIVIRHLHFDRRILGPLRTCCFEEFQNLWVKFWCMHRLPPQTWLRRTPLSFVGRQPLSLGRPFQRGPGRHIRPPRPRSIARCRPHLRTIRCRFPRFHSYYQMPPLRTSTVSGLILWVKAFKTNTRFFSSKAPIYPFLFEIALLFPYFNFILHRFKVAKTTV